MSCAIAKVARQTPNRARAKFLTGAALVGLGKNNNSPLAELSPCRWMGGMLESTTKWANCSQDLDGVNHPEKVFAIRFADGQHFVANLHGVVFHEFHMLDIDDVEAVNAYEVFVGEAAFEVFHGGEHGVPLGFGVKDYVVSERLDI